MVYSKSHFEGDPGHTMYCHALPPRPPYKDRPPAVRQHVETRDVAERVVITSHINSKLERKWTSGRRAEARQELQQKRVAASKARRRL